MNLIALSIRRPVFAWVLMASLIIFGSIFFNRLGVSQMPDVDFPVLTVSVNYEGASPEVVESELIDPIEQQLLSVEGIKEMRSSVRQGSGSVTLEFDINRDVNVKLQEVQSALSQMRMPDGVDPPVVNKRNPEEQPIMFLGVSTSRPMRETISWVENELLDQFRFLPGAGEVSVGGFSQRNLRIWPKLEKLKEADLTVTDILDAIDSQHQETAAGQFTSERRELRVRWLGEVASPEEMGNVRILRRGGQVIHNSPYRIRDVAAVEDGLSDVRRMARVNGKEAISILVKKQRGGNEVLLAQAVRKTIESLKGKIPEGYEVQTNIDFTRSTEAVVSTTKEKLWIAAIVTIVICFLFLGSWQAALNILFSIPTSIIGTFIIVYFSGFTLNLFSLLALTLAVSIVVDDAIMLLENIVRHHRMGKPAAQAAYDGAMEILPAATAATMAVVAVFLPVIFMEGVTGKFFFQFGVTMSAAVLLSLLEAVTITPMRAAALLSQEAKISPLEQRIDHTLEGWAARYRSWLERALQNSKQVVFGSLALFVASIFLAKAVKNEFVPAQDQDVIMMSGQTPPGTSLQATFEKAVEVEELVRKSPHVKSLFFSVGAGGPNSEVNQFTLPVYLHPKKERTLSHTEIMDVLRKELKAVSGVRVTMRDMSSRGLTAGRMYPLSFNLKGPDLEVLRTKAEEISKRLTDEGLAIDMDTDFKVGIPELLVQPDREAMAARGVAVATVSRTLNATVAGVRQSRFTSGGHRYDIRVKLPQDHVRSPADIRNIDVRNNYGIRVPLASLVTFQEKPTYQSINRVNRQRTVGVFGNLAKGKGQGQVLARAEAIAKEVLPSGYTLSLEGSAAGLNDSFRNLTVALVLGLLVAYMILAVQFNSFVHPISVLVALPFSVTGALFSLWIFGVSLNLFSFIGIIVLMGIAKKNSILLVEFTNQIRARGTTDVKTAILEACPVRLRPILMTSAATVAAALPLVLGSGIGQETRTPMGLTIIGGTIVSTAFTLFVVPGIYQMLTKLERKRTSHMEVRT